jgi:hypothetical protein
MKNVHVQRRKPAAGRKVSRLSKPPGHMPRLDTIQMVEETIKSDKVFTSKNQLWRGLPKSMQYNTLLTILDYLEKSNKIMFEKDGTIVWTFVDSPEGIKSLEESTPL